MTHEEIQDAIEQLRELGGDGRLTSSNIIDVFSGNTYKVRDTLVDILRQADPDTHMIQPVDADGEPINIGDEMDFSEGVRGLTVIGVGISSVNDSDMGVFVRDDDGYTWFNARFLHHHHTTTVEDVLREYGDEVRRCCDTEDTITEYAAKLREVMADDEAR